MLCAAWHNFANISNLDPAHFVMHVLAPEEGGKTASSGHQLYRSVRFAKINCVDTKTAARSGEPGAD